MLDWSRTPPAPLRPESGDSIAELGVEAEGAFFGPFRSPAFSAVLDASGHPLEIPEAAELRYTVKLRRGGAGSPILLASPVVDDVTLYFDAGTPRILAWVRS
jgi:hypothetical protein